MSKTTDRVAAGERPATGADDRQRPKGGGGDWAETITFPQGLPGFPGATTFGLQPLAGADGRLLVMQSTEDAGLRFLVMPCDDRRLPLARIDLDAACGAVGVQPEDAAFLLVATAQRVAGRDGAEQRQLYVNLRAPVVLDTLRRTAVQHVLASPAYPVRHLLQAAG
jgi:flagellar assembly factor FliW